MNLVGKILVVAVTVMALVFAAFTLAVHATHKNWKLALDNPNPNRAKGEVPGKLQELADKDTQIQRQNTELNDLKLKISRLVNEYEQRLGQLDSSIAELLTANKALDAERAQKTTALQEATVNSSKAATVLTNTQDENKQLREKLAKLIAERDEAFDSVVKLQDALAQATGEASRHETRNRVLLTQLAQHRQVMQDLKLPLTLETPDVEGKITRTHTAEKLVQINLGSDDGLRVGVKMDVFRLGSSLNNTRYLGQIVLTRVDKTEAVGSVVVSEATIQERDNVITRPNK